MAEEMAAAGLAPEHVDMLFEKYEEARAAEEQDKDQRGPPQGQATPSTAHALILAANLPKRHKHMKSVTLLARHIC